MEPKDRIWQVSPAAARTPALALALLVFLLLLGEVGARSALVRSRLAAPSIGSRSRFFDLQLSRLDRMAKDDGGVDCIFLGNSLVLFGMDPDSFSAAYEARGGSRLRAYNFSIPGLLASDNAALARILTEDYRPSLIIYGMTPRDFSDRSNRFAFESIPWVRYRMGFASVDGWLVEHSRAFRYLLLSENKLPAAAERAMRGFDSRAPRGFFPFEPATTNVEGAAFVNAMKLVSAELKHSMAPAQVSALGALLKVRDGGTQLVLLEMPMRLDPSEWSADLSAGYRKMWGEFRSVLQASGATVWSPPPQGIVPADGWLDAWHMNARGASPFSRWLGERLAAAVAAGELARPDPVRTRPQP